jgi:hypothetical protein
VTDEWTVMLVPFSFIDETDEVTGKPRITVQIHGRRAVSMSNDVTAAERKTFYQSLLKISWLPPALRRVIMKEMGLSLHKQKREFEDGWTMGVRHMIEKRKTALRAQGLRPRGGIHELAVAEMAREFGMTVDAVKKRLQRYKQRRRI